MDFREFIRSVDLDINDQITRAIIEYISDLKNINKATIFSDSFELTYEDIYALRDVILRLRQGTPLSYITGRRTFFRDDFIVDENVLIPRYETEILVERLLEISNNKKILELGTGSGCIAISCLKYSRPDIVVSSDISYKAIMVAKNNADNLLNKEQRDRLLFVNCDRFKAIKGSFDIIVSNPPYIEKVQYSELDRSVKEYEPEIALTDEDDGLSFYRYILSVSSFLLNKDGIVILEHGYDQKETITELFSKRFRNILSIKDYSDHDRILVISKPI